MSNIQIILKNDVYLDHTVPPITLTDPIYAGDACAQRIMFRVFRKHGDIAPVNMTELAIRAYFTRPDGSSVIMDGVSGREWSYVDLPAACYAYPGNFDFVIKSVETPAESTIVRVLGRLDKPVSGTIVDPGTDVGNLEEIVNDFLEIENAKTTCVEAAETATAAIETVAASAESASADRQAADEAAAAAQESAQAAGASAASASESETSASGSAAAAAASETNAAGSATDAAGSAEAAAASKAAAQAAQTAAQAAQTAAQAAQTAAEAAAAEEVADWLAAHVDPDTGYVLDNTLAIEGAAADAKAVGDAVDDLKSAIDTITGAEWIQMNLGYIRTNIESGINKDTINSSTTNCYAVVPCVENDKFTIRAYTATGAYPRAYVFIDADGTRLTPFAASGETCDNLVITAPENAVYVIVQSSIEYEPYCIKGILPKNDIAILKQSAIKINEELYDEFTCPTTWALGLWGQSNGATGSSNEQIRSASTGISDFSYILKADDGIVFHPNFYDSTGTHVSIGTNPWITECNIAEVAPTGAATFRITVRTEPTTTLTGLIDVTAAKVHWLKSRLTELARSVESISDEKYHEVESGATWTIGIWGSTSGNSGNRPNNDILRSNSGTIEGLDYYIKTDSDVLFQVLFYNGSSYVTQSSYPWRTECNIAEIVPSGATEFRLNLRTENYDTLTNIVDDTIAKVHFYVDNKVATYQGTENARKFLRVNSAGAVEPSGAFDGLYTWTKRVMGLRILADAQGCYFIPFTALGQGVSRGNGTYGDDFYRDQIHPTPLGAYNLAAGIWSYLRHIPCWNTSMPSDTSTSPALDGTQWSGKSWYAYGTSLTHGTATGNKYADYLANFSGLVQTNKGYSGGALVSPPNHHVFDRLTDATDGKLDADLITIEVSANDSGPLGDPWTYDTNTFYGALNYAIRKMFNDGIKAQVVIMASYPPRYPSGHPEQPYGTDRLIVRSNDGD